MLDTYSVGLWLIIQGLSFPIDIDVPLPHQVDELNMIRMYRGPVIGCRWNKTRTTSFLIISFSKSSIYISHNATQMQTGGLKRVMLGVVT